METIKQLFAEWPVISAAPLSFALAVAIAAGVIWWLVNKLFSSERNGLKAQIGAQTERIALLKEKFDDSELARARLETALADMDKQIEKLKSSPSDKVALSALAYTSGNAVNALHDLTISGTELRRLFLSPGYQTIIAPQSENVFLGTSQLTGPAPQSPPATKRDP